MDLGKHQGARIRSHARPTAFALVLGFASMGSTPARAESTADFGPDGANFLAENDAAMAKMMTDMAAMATLLASTILAAALPALAGQAPVAVSAPDIAVSHHDRVYAAEQVSNTVSVTDPADNTLLGVIRLGVPQPANMRLLCHGQVLVHGLGFSPDHRTLAVVSIGSNSVNLIDTATNRVKHVTYLGRSPHEAFFTPDGKELWVSIRGEDYIAVLDAATFEERTRSKVPGGPGMQIFSPDGRYGYVCSSFHREIVVIEVARHRIIGRVRQASPFCPNIAATPDGTQVWLTSKDIGKTLVFDARPPFAVLEILDTGPITNLVNFAATAQGGFAYVTIGGTGEVKVYRTDDFSQVATIPVGKLPHGLWPSGDGSRIYVGLENQDALAAIGTRSNRVVATIPIGQAPQAVVYVPNAVPEGGRHRAPAAAGAGRCGRHFGAWRRRRRTGHRGDQRCGIAMPPTIWFRTAWKMPSAAGSSGGGTATPAAGCSRSCTILRSTVCAKGSVAAGRWRSGMPTTRPWPAAHPARTTPCAAAIPAMAVDQTHDSYNILG